jgi:hypothetical protein
MDRKKQEVPPLRFHGTPGQVAPVPRQAGTGGMAGRMTILWENQKRNSRFGVTNSLLPCGIHVNWLQCSWSVRKVLARTLGPISGACPEGLVHGSVHT